MALNIADATNSEGNSSSISNKILDLFVSPLTITIIILAFVMGYFFEWWTVAIAAFMGGAIFGKSGSETFAKGTTAISTLWLLVVLYHHFSTLGILSNKIAQILPVGGNVGVLITVTVLIGGIVGGWGAMSGFFVRNLFRK